MVKVKYVRPANLRERVLGLREARDELCRLCASYRFSSPEYRRLSEGIDALDQIAAALVGEPELLQPPLTPSDFGR